jgi:hypothetical protein
MHKGAGAEHSVLVVMLLICANLVMASKAGYEQHDPTLLASLQLHAAAQQLAGHIPIFLPPVAAFVWYFW